MEIKIISSEGISGHGLIPKTYKAETSHCKKNGILSFP